MAVQTPNDFLSRLQNCGLLTDTQMQSLRQQLQDGRKRSLEKIAAKLVQQQYLTQWQADQLLKGQKSFNLQQYQLMAPVGHGGMGHVFKARDSRSGQIVAIKVMAKSLLDNETLVSRFRREIKASARLNSPHIVKAMNAGKVGGTDFLVMEYVNGQQVDQIASKLGRLPIDLACEILRQAAVGLQHAHECGMVHRDIKPANLMIHWEADGGGTVKLMDMGLVRLTEETEDQSVTRAGQVMGTPDYMSPEQGWDTSKVDIRSDIYGLGCTCFRLLTGSVPFSGANPLQVLSQRLQRDAPSVATLRPDVPAELATAICRMTARDPAGRYQTPTQVAAALSPFCTPLTRTALDAAPISHVTPDSGSRDAVGGSGTGDSSETTDTRDFDGTYHQFLKDMQDGAAVDLAAVDAAAVGVPEKPTGTVEFDATLPALQVEEPVFSVQNRRTSRSGPRRGQLAGFIIMGLATLVLILIGIFLWQRGVTP